MSAGRPALLPAARSAAAAGELRRAGAADQGSRQREQLRSDLIALFEHDFTELRARVLRLENGPPVGYPVQFRISAPTSRRCASWQQGRRCRAAK
jgi:hypothetical protein